MTSEDDLEGLSEAARAGNPQRLADLLRDYDAAKIRWLTRSFVGEQPIGEELL